jgi:hypothetical protein
MILSRVSNMQLSPVASPAVQVQTWERLAGVLVQGPVFCPGSLPVPVRVPVPAPNQIKTKLTGFFVSRVARARSTKGKFPKQRRPAGRARRSPPGCLAHAGGRGRGRAEPAQGDALSGAPHLAVRRPAPHLQALCPVNPSLARAGQGAFPS